jgi:hypothetical protein
MQPVAAAAAAGVAESVLGVADSASGVADSASGVAESAHAGKQQQEASDAARMSGGIDDATTGTFNSSSSATEMHGKGSSSDGSSSIGADVPSKNGASDSSDSSGTSSSSSSGDAEGARGVCAARQQVATWIVLPDSTPEGVAQQLKDIGELDTHLLRHAQLHLQLASAQVCPLMPWYRLARAWYA